jgi:hypothetical protein
LCERHLGVGASILKELSLHGVRRLRCPGCQVVMTEERLRGQPVDLCAGCGGAWLDERELTTLTRGVIPEIKARATTTAAPPPSGASVAPSTLLDEARAVFGPLPTTSASPEDAATVGASTDGAPTPTAPVLTLEPASTDDAARLEPVGWVIPCTKCDTALDVTQDNWLVDGRPWCAACARPIAGVGATWWWLTGLLTQWWSLPWWRSEAPPSSLRRPDTLRIEPADAEVYFASFRRRSRVRQERSS